MTILVAGASGLVGSAFVRAAARRGHRVIGFTHAHEGPLEGLTRRVRVDLTDEGATTSAVLDVFPEAIVNCAAVSVPERCEADPARAQALNVALPALLGRLAHHVSARFVHLSSEQVFDGTRTTPYAAGDTPRPINLYARQKLASEQAVLSAAPAFATVLRLPLLMGNSPGGARSNHERLLADWAAGRTPRLFTDEFRQPCTAENVAEVILELCERNDTRGLFHWAGAELLSRHEMGRRIREHFRLTERQAPIEAVTRADNPAAVRSRQPCLAIDCAPLAGRLKVRPQSFAAQLEELHVPPAVRAWYHGLSG
jgi:dTDP-4-dehydrorhamnose reductase